MYPLSRRSYACLTAGLCFAIIACPSADSPTSPTPQPPVNQQYALSISTTGGGQGTVSTNPSGVSFAPGTAIQLDAVPQSSSQFSGWSGACSGSSPTCSIVMDAHKSVTATFVLRQFTLSVVTAGTGSGTVTRNPSSTSYQWGTTVQLTATAATGSTFAGWSGACAGTAGTCTITMDADKNVTATFNTTSTVLFADDFSSGTIDPSRWFVSADGNVVGLTATFGNPSPAMLMRWPNTSAAVTWHRVSTAQTFDASRGFTVTFDFMEPSPLSGDPRVIVSFGVSLIGVNGSLAGLSGIGTNIAVGCPGGGGNQQNPILADRAFHRHTITMSPTGVFTWSRDGVVLIDGSLPGCRDPRNVTSYKLEFSAHAHPNPNNIPFEKIAVVDNVRVTRP